MRRATLRLWSRAALATSLRLAVELEQLELANDNDLKPPAAGRRTRLARVPKSRS